ncbi:MAG: M18 family aminopeptidase, partial [Lachnospiraceae bacterium]|nr:M18 family aminopeptidase [Lachnospiraceae bacterium]
IGESMGKSGGAYLQLLAGSFMISADNAHGVHPNHPEKADSTCRPYLNEGIVIKYHGGQKYTTDAYSEAVMKELCRKAEVPCQVYCNRSDIPGGSTLGNISAGQVSIPAVDIGIAQLAMHSAVETAGSADVEYLVRVLSRFYRE